MDDVQQVIQVFSWYCGFSQKAPKKGPFLAPNSHQKHPFYSPKNGSLTHYFLRTRYCDFSDGTICGAKIQYDNNAFLVRNNQYQYLTFKVAASQRVSIEMPDNVLQSEGPWCFTYETRTTNRPNLTTR